jgi:hypothetical protein
MGFNLNYDSPIYMIADLRGCYDIGEVVSYREWHDGFIFERLLKIYTAHGMRVHNLTPDVEGLAAFQTFTSIAVHDALQRQPERISYPLLK